MCAEGENSEPETGVRSARAEQSRVGNRSAFSASRAELSRESGARSARAEPSRKPEDRMIRLFCQKVRVIGSKADAKGAGEKGCAELNREADSGSRFRESIPGADSESRFREPIQRADSESRFREPIQRADSESRFREPIQRADSESRFREPIQRADSGEFRVGNRSAFSASRAEPSRKPERVQREPSRAENRRTE
ncbi:hypothetical protein C0J45_12882 [Silurus meridionalis]|nr:hypothetical protein C0J45_12882 [Silurus meridionalis]